MEGREAHLAPGLSVESEGPPPAAFRMPSVLFSVPGEVLGRWCGYPGQACAPRLPPAGAPQQVTIRAPLGLQARTSGGSPPSSPLANVWMAGLVGLSMKLFLGVPAPQHSGS